MNIRPFPTPLPEIIVFARLRELDPYVKLSMHPRTDETGQTINTAWIESTLSDSRIQNAITTPQTTQETTAVQAFEDSVTAFNNLPGWATWAPAEFETWCNANLMTDTQIDALSLNAALKTNLKANNTFTRSAGKAIIYLRDYIIKFRR